MKSIGTLFYLCLIIMILGCSINYSFALKIVNKFSHKNDFLKQDSTHYLPSPDFWITKGVEIVDGNEFCYNPHHSIEFKRDTSFIDSLPATIRYKTWKKYTPVFRLNRVDTNGKEYNLGKKGGDYIESHIIDIRNKFNSNITLSYQRTGKILPSTDCGWSDSIMYGPEHRVILNGDAANEYRKPDKLIVEIIGSTNPDSLVNISDKDWINYPRRNGAPSETQNPAMTIFGGGGYRRAFLETDKDSVLTYNDGLRSDLYDDGKDKYFHKAFIVIPDAFVKMGYIRLRVRVEAEDNSIGQFKDDYDDFFVESLDLYTVNEKEEISIDNAFISNPYSIITRNQAIKIPVTIRISNNSNVTGLPNRIHLLIKNLKDTITDFDFNNMNYPYTRSESYPFIKELTSTNIQFPNADFLNFDVYTKIKLQDGENKFQILAAFPDTSYTQFEETGLFKENSMFYSEFSIYFDNVLAYDNPLKVRNDIPDFTGMPGNGLKLYGYANGDDYSNYSDIGDGQIAMKFKLLHPDTIYGFQAFFGSLNQFLDDIAWSIYSDSLGLPGQIVQQSLSYCYRGYVQIRKDVFFDEYVTYKYNKPLTLPAGSYWAAITQFGETGLSLGASKYRMGMQALNYDTNYNSSKSKFLLINDNLKQGNKYVDTCRNNIIFAYENTRWSGYWTPFTPDTGNPAFAHLNAAGSSRGSRFGSFSRGTFVPMIRILMKSPGTFDNVESNTSSISNLSISPNPATDFIEISVPADLNQRFKSLVQDIHVYFAFGEEVPIPNCFESVSSSAFQCSLRLDVSGFVPGVYFVKIGDRVSKFVKI